MTDTRKTMQQALEALQPFAVYGRHGSRDIETGAAIAAIEALRDVLSQQDTIKELAEQSMLSLWESYCDKKMQVEELQEKLAALAQQGEQQPVDRVAVMQAIVDRDTGHRRATPAAQPLTDEQIKAKAMEAFSCYWDADDETLVNKYGHGVYLTRFIDFARDIEAAHGIGADK